MKTLKEITSTKAACNGILEEILKESFVFLISKSKLKRGKNLDYELKKVSKKNAAKTK